MEAVTITLNGREVSGYPGMTVLELARESGIYIPTLCHDPHLTPSGACRICLVEDERNGALLASCITPITPGMEINTQSQRVIDHRKTIVKLMLASHPDSCLVCDKGNRCQLRQIAADMGIGWVEFGRIQKQATIEEVNPFIERDLSKCILCARCIRACQELVVQGAIDYFQRGFATKVATLFDSPLENSECTFCGTCVSLCPTGALTEKDRDYSGSTRTTVDSTCPFCGCGCSITIEVKDNKILRVTPGKDDTVNYGALCVRGSYGCDFIHSPDRLTAPLTRKDDSFEEVSWDIALEKVASEFNKIKQKYGPDSLAVFGSSKCTNEENYLLQRFARCVLGTNNIDNGARLYNITSGINNISTYNLPIARSFNDTLEQSDLIMVIGANLSSSAPIIEYAIKRAVKSRGAKLILVDPRQIKLSSFCHLQLQNRVNTDAALLNSLAKVIIDDEGLQNTDNSDNFKAFVASLKEYTPEYAEAITGIPAHNICATARLYATASKATIIYGSGITRQSNSTNNIRAISNLATLTGNGIVYAVQEDNNGLGACYMGCLPDFLPGYQDLNDSQVRNKFEVKWGVQIPSGNCLTAPEIIEQIKAGDIKGLYIVGENPVLSFPNQALVTEALGSLDFKVVQDMFLSDTAKMADVVLPAASFAEKDGTFTNFEGRRNTIKKAIEPPGESLPDWEIIIRLAEKFGSPLPFSSLQDIQKEIQELVPTQQEEKTRRQSHFYPVEQTPLGKENKEYPFTLITGSSLYSFGSGTRSSRARRLNKYSPDNKLEIGERDVAKLGINDGDKVKITSPISELTCTAIISNTLLPDTVFMNASNSESQVNRLFSIELDPVSKTPSLKTCNVRIERIEPDD